MNESNQENFAGEVNWVVSWSWENVTFLVEGTADVHLWEKCSVRMVWCKGTTQSSGGVQERKRLSRFRSSHCFACSITEKVSV